MEPKGSLPYSQVPSTCPYPEPARSSLYPHVPLSEDPFEYYHPRLGLSSGLFFSGFPTKNLFTSLLSPISATCPVRLILLDFITQTILGEEYRSLNSLVFSTPLLPHPS